MATVPHSAVPPGTTLDAVPEESWVVHPVNWTAVWVGTLASVAAVLLFGLVGVALGAHLVGPEYRVVALKNIALGTLAFSEDGRSLVTTGDDRTLRVRYERTAPDGALFRETTIHSLRYVHPQECRYLLQLAGLQVTDVFGDYELGPLSNDSPRMIVCARRIAG